MPCMLLCMPYDPGIKYTTPFFLVGVVRND